MNHSKIYGVQKLGFVLLLLFLIFPGFFLSFFLLILLLVVAIISFFLFFARIQIKKSQNQTSVFEDQKPSYKTKSSKNPFRSSFKTSHSPIKKEISTQDYKIQ